MKKKKIIIVGVSLAAVLSTGMFAITRNLSYMRNVELHGINLASLDDGSFTGTFERGRFTNTLTVDVESNRIVRISIDDDVWGGRITDVSEEVFSRVIEAQDTKIDVVSGATVTTNAYLKAIENALNAD